MKVQQPHITPAGLPPRVANDGWERVHRPGLIGHVWDHKMALLLLVLLLVWWL